MIQAAEDFPTSVSTWSELADLIEHFSYYNGHDWLFRGVTDATHGLVPKIGREKTRKLETTAWVEEADACSVSP